MPHWGIPTPVYATPGRGDCVGRPVDCRPPSAKPRWLHVAGQRPSTGHLAPGLREGSVSDPEPTLKLDPSVSAPSHVAPMAPGGTSVSFRPIPTAYLLPVKACSPSQSGRSASPTHRRPLALDRNRLFSSRLCRRQVRRCESVVQSLDLPLTPSLALYATRRPLPNPAQDSLPVSGHPVPRGTGRPPGAFRNFTPSSLQTIRTHEMGPEDHRRPKIGSAGCRPKAR